MTKADAWAPCRVTGTPSCRATVECKPSAPMSRSVLTSPVEPSANPSATPCTRPVVSVSIRSSRVSWCTAAPASDRCIDQDRIEHGPAWCGQAGDLLAGGHVEFENLRPIAERRLRDDRGPGSPHLSEQPPAVQSGDRSPHEGVGRQRVAAVGPFVDDQDTKTAASEQHGGGGAGSTRSHDDGVVVPVRAGEVFVGSGFAAHASSGERGRSSVLGARVENA